MTLASGTAEGVAHDDDVEVSLESEMVEVPLALTYDKEEVETSPHVVHDTQVVEEKPLGLMKRLFSVGAGPKDKDKPEEKPLASVKEVFSFGAGPKKIICLVLGFFCAVVSGAVFPALAFLWSESFKDLGASTSGDDFLKNIRGLAFSLMILGAFAFVFMSGQAAFLETAAEDMTHSFKTQWFDALLRQDMAYYDIKEVSATATIISTNGAKYKKGLGRKLAASLQFTITFFGGLAYGFWASWQVSLLLLATLPVMTGATLFLVQLNQTQSARASAGYAEAGSIVQVTVSSLRTILSLNAVEATIDKFVAATQKAYNEGVKLLRAIGMANGMVMSTMILGYLVLVLYGAYLLYDQVRTTGCDPSGTVPNTTTCNPEASGVFGALMGITIAASILPQVSVGLEAFSGRCMLSVRLSFPCYVPGN
jgi:ATP-binding cassette subfamily B (MDR/TAP) protein 1